MLGRMLRDVGECKKKKFAFELPKVKMKSDIFGFVVKKFFARWTNGRAFARSRTNEQTSFHSYEDERSSRRANYDVFVDRDCQASCALAFALGRCGVPCRRRKQSAASAWSCGDDD